MKYSLLFLILTLTMETFAQKTPYELSDKNQTATYQQAIDFYKQLAKASPQAKLLSYGTTDVENRSICLSYPETRSLTLPKSGKIIKEYY